MSIEITAITGATPPALIVVRDAGKDLAWARTDGVGAVTIGGLGAGTYEVTAYVAEKPPQTRRVIAT
jgi:hypothetical protein